MAAHAEFNLKLGATMKTQSDPKGKIDDAKVIENTILSYEPMHMVSFKVMKAPQGFPFPNAIIHFTDNVRARWSTPPSLEAWL